MFSNGYNMPALTILMVSGLAGKLYTFSYMVAKRPSFQSNIYRYICCHNKVNSTNRLKGAVWHSLTLGSLSCCHPAIG